LRKSDDDDDDDHDGDRWKGRKCKTKRRNIKTEDEIVVRKAKPQEEDTE